MTHVTAAGSTRPFTGTPSQVVVEQLAALGVRYVFNNTGSHEAAFFDALYGHAGIHGILGLHEGVVTSMAGGYAQVGPRPAVMLAHLDAGLGQSLGQMLNVWNAKLPVVTLTYAADTGSAVDKRGWGHHIDHSFGPTYLSAPYVKASWAVIDPAGLAHAVYRAVLTAMTPPVGPVHLAIYEDAIGMQPIEAAIIEGPLPELRAGYPSDAEVEAVMRALAGAQRPLLYVGDGIWKSGAAHLLDAFADRVGARVADGDQFNRAVQPNHPLHGKDLAALDPDFVLAIGVRQHSFSRAQAAYRKFPHARVVAVGPDVENFTNMEGLSAAVVADEARMLERLEAWLDAGSGAAGAATATAFAERRERALQAAEEERSRRHATRQTEPAPDGAVRAWVLADEIHKAAEAAGGAHVTMENFALWAWMGGIQPPGRSEYIPQAGGSEGYGMGAALGVKLAAPDVPVIGVVGDGSVLYADTAFWTAAHHRVPVLYVVPNNCGYGVVAGSFVRVASEGAMGAAGEWPGVVLDGIDLVGVARAYGVEGRDIRSEAELPDALRAGLEMVQRERRPYLLNVHLPSVLPEGGRQAAPFQLA
ncbi:MAG: thiamine pyrophosphate-binding protein [Spirochaetaceae bacterium]|nr:thiamine pyrophosphate-binding protein [Spirochaetaceae bacterium]